MSSIKALKGGGARRVIQVVLSNKKLKDFEAEVVRIEETESTTAVGLIMDGLKYRTMERKMVMSKHPFFNND